MPIYTYQCAECGTVEEHFNTVSERHTNAPECHGKMGIAILTAPQGYVQRECRYVCPVTNEKVTTWRQRKNIMAREGLVDANDLISSHQKRKMQEERIKRQKAEWAAKTPEAVKEYVDKWVDQEKAKI